MKTITIDGIEYDLIPKVKQDKDNILGTVNIGGQHWDMKNLNIDTFQNGDPIMLAKTNKEWIKANEDKTPAWCYYDNNPKNGEKYGKLYNWYAVNDPRGLAPKGYHVPSKAEWDNLVSYLGGPEISGKKLKSTEGWREEGNGTNESGFSGLPGGYRGLIGGFGDVGDYAGFWSATEGGTYGAWYYVLGYYDDNVYSFYSSGGVGLSVRCLRD